MKKNIHPQFYTDCVVTCACGNSFTTGSTKPKIQVDICSACHPFFTGKMKFVDSLGRVEKFQNKMKAALDKKYIKKAARKKIKAKTENQRPATLKEMLEQSRQKNRA